MTELACLKKELDALKENNAAASEAMQSPPSKKTKKGKGQNKKPKSLPDLNKRIRTHIRSCHTVTISISISFTFAGPCFSKGPSQAAALQKAYHKCSMQVTL